MRSISLVIFMLLLASCATKAGDTTDRLQRSKYLLQPVARFASVDQTYETYRTGIAQIMESFPEEPEEKDGPLRGLYEYKAIYRRLGWSRIDRENKIYALTPGKIPGCWVSFVEPDHPQLESRDNTLHTALNKGGIILIIARPDKISVRWAGIFLVHELSHARNYLEKGTLDEKTSEYSAYDLEKKACNLITKNAFDGVLDSVLETYNIVDVAELLHAEPKQRAIYLNEIDHRMNENPGLSIAEMEMRHGFYMMAMILRLSERLGDDAGTAAEKVNKAIKAFSLF